MNTINGMETVTSKDGTKIAYKVTGSGPPLVLVPGGGANDHTRWELAGVRPSFAEHFTVYAIDGRGLGESGETEEYELEREFEDVAAVVDAIVEPVNLLGHSSGALLTLEAALRTENISKLILYEPPLSGDGQEIITSEVIDELNAFLDDGHYEQVLIHFLRKVAGIAPDDIDRLRKAPNWQNRVDGAHTICRGIQGIRDYVFDPERFTELYIPTLLISGGESPQIYRNATKAVHEALPNSRISIIEGEKHVAMNNVPDHFIEEVVTFIRE